MVNNEKYYDDYLEVINHLKKEKRQIHLLLGNGFSRAYDNDIFSYKSLSEYARKDGDDSVAQLFEITKTSNFEEAIHSVDISIELVKYLQTSDAGILEKLENLSGNAKKSLIDAITQMHPECVLNLKENEIENCGLFLSPYLEGENKGSIISTNYDLLLYWVLMRYRKKENSELSCCDAFSYDRNNYDSCRGSDADGHSLIWTPDNNQNVFYLHGALHLFSSMQGIMKEQYKGTAASAYILERIKDRIDQNQYPIFVTEGDGEAKKKQIYRNIYLANCYEHLKSLNGSLVTFGFSFGDSDQHIIDAINKAASHKDRFWSIYIGVFSEQDKEHISAIRSKFNVKVNMFDAKTVKLWRW